MFIDYFIGFLFGLSLPCFFILKQKKKELSLIAQNLALEAEKKVLLFQIESFKDHFSDHKKQIKIEFELLAHKIFEHQSLEFSQRTEKKFEQFLEPLKEKIQIFEKSIEEKFSSESKERYVLKNEMQKLMTLNHQMSKEANSLAQALRSDSKIQGDWGELILERVLESSGLRKDQEYLVQKTYSADDGNRYRPDVVVCLPEDKHIIIDSKVSLKAYDLYRSCDDEKVQKKYLSDHIKSLEKHIDDLSQKHYSKLKGIHSPEFVFLFIPVEPAYIKAMQEDSELSARAWKKGVALVTGTTLLTSLKTVASIWTLEKQNKNALEIAQEGAKLYDKFVGFVEDFEKIGKVFDHGQKYYSDAFNKLKDGPGNIFKKMEHMRELGAAPQKRLSKD